MVIVTADCDAAKILRNMGLADKNKARRHLAACIKERADPYAPYDTGLLKNTAQISPNGKYLTYVGPYAHYQYHGKVMGPNVLTKDGWRSMAPKGGKYYTGKDLTYQGAPMRGPQWVDRALAAHGDEIRRDLADYCNDRGGNR